MDNFKRNVFLYLLVHYALMISLNGAFSNPVALIGPGEINGNFMLKADGFWARPWTLLTYGVMHAGLIHLLMNVWGLKVLMKLGLQEVKFKALAVVYGVSLVVSGLFILAIPAANNLGTVGASGAIFGLLGFLTVHYRFTDLRGALLFTVALNAVLPILIPIISWQGHLGGFLAGVTLALMANYQEFRDFWRETQGQLPQLFHAVEGGPISEGQLKHLRGLAWKTWVLGSERYALAYRAETIKLLQQLKDKVESQAEPAID